MAVAAGLADDWEAQQQTCVDALIDQLRLDEGDSTFDVRRFDFPTISYVRYKNNKIVSGGEPEGLPTASSEPQ